MRKLLNFIAFQICWFANVLGAANAMPWAGPAITLVWMVAHLAALRGPDARRERSIEACIIVAAMSLGWLADSCLHLLNLTAFPENGGLAGSLPGWMVALWVCFAATLRHSLGWLRGRWLTGALLGAVGGPLAYLAGESFGAIALGGNTAIAAVSVQFALATPILLALVRFAERPLVGARNQQSTRLGS